MALMSMARPAGTPSRIATSALPCDSPAVRNRNISRFILSEIFAVSGRGSRDWRRDRTGRFLAPSSRHSRRRMRVMQLVADRFAVDDNGRARDLATGAAVTLTLGTAGGISEQMRWAARCDGWQKLHHRAIAPLLDYGMVGGSSRFEAWLCGSRWPGAPDAAQSALDVATPILRASGVSAGAAAVGSMR